MKDNDGSLMLDRLDLKILSKLQKNGRITNQELADSVGLSASPCLNRVKRMEKAGVITGYQTHIELAKLCRYVDVIAAVTLKEHGLDNFALFESTIETMRYIVDCTKVSGPIDYLVRFICPDISAYQMLSDELLRICPIVSNLSSYIVLKSIKPYRGVSFEDLI
ncbi:TPA: Lrp/AsnC family transcriptional regulator [Klebsiella quasipneumoniae subsp. quasipneumoniae]|uniref:Lrp/AsnC family transcriptional regulator n=1 Tax=Klebsiella pneumoniae complex TaxID=3390273 RepID=UPI000D592919|nr:Lrp/AsnC family transcriptional regulator [Klebsiella pneumoniae]HBW1846710.1 Lrp/AsnC family transcriptional regulator [Klebsiella quasipneumoniae subsp. quasipneumoniae]HCM5370790.1 Lrp/AsnC family transcriptional regulator [Klebsiella variicola subsp. variicola]HDS6868541.1 Lrp/AsnC family transcriptional regulator [Klebsiella pneumoniae subsp. pneumoniae]HBX8239881.1 Lrp/AsnC family transcriptional regulator [Klebsiella pneumoniae]HCM7678247.1 Lrp/AsnC family transcriptional regulator [